MALLPEDLDIVKRDRSLPGLRLLLDGQRLARAAQDAGGSQQNRLTPDYVRYKPGVNCVARYAAPSGTDTELHYAKAFGTDAGSKLAKVRALSPEGRMVLDGEGVFLARFPLDDKLRSIGRLGDREGRERLLSRIFKNDQAWCTGELEVLNYKPERRLVCRLRRPDGRSAVVKFYTAAGFTGTRHLKRLASTVRGIRLPRWIGGSKKHGVHAFEWMEGDTLRDLADSGEKSLAAHRDAGQLLAELHRSDPAGLPRAHADRLDEELRSLAKQLSWLLPSAEREAHRVAAGLAEAFNGRADEDCFLHADFYNKQVLAGPGGASLIDLDRARSGAAGEDLGCFLAHREKARLAEMAGAGGDGSVEALFAGYESAGGRIDDRALARWTGLALFRLSHQPFRDRAADWPQLTREMLACCTEWLRRAEAQRG